MNSFHVGDKVIIKSQCNTTEVIGRIIRYIDYPEQYHRKYVQVKLDTGRIQSYNENSLMLVGE